MGWFGPKFTAVCVGGPYDGQIVKKKNPWYVSGTISREFADGYRYDLKIQDGEPIFVATSTAETWYVGPPLPKPLTNEQIEQNRREVEREYLRIRGGL